MTAHSFLIPCLQYLVSLYAHSMSEEKMIRSCINATECTPVFLWKEKQQILCRTVPLAI